MECALIGFRLHTDLFVDYFHPLPPEPYCAITRVGSLNRTSRPWNAQQHVDMAWYRLAFHRFHVLLSAQFPKNFADRSTCPSEKLLLAVLWQDHNVILALPLHVGLTLPILHDGSPFALWGLPQGDRLSPTTQERQSLMNSHRQRRWIS